MRDELVVFLTAAESSTKIWPVKYSEFVQEIPQQPHFRGQMTSSLC